MRLVVDKTWDGHGVGPMARVELFDGGEVLGIRVDARFHGDPPPVRSERLWEHEVVELFVVGPDAVYTEIELSPHGLHLVLQLRGVRQPVATGLPLEFSARIEGDRWTGEARLARDLLPPGPHRLNAYAIHGLGDARRYLAAHPVPGPQPDFHRIHLFPEARLP